MMAIIASVPIAWGMGLPVGSTANPTAFPAEMCPMLLLPESRLALLLPWKTASQTLRARLEGLATSPYPKAWHFNPWLRRVAHQHLTLHDWAALPESSLGYELAVFVRNPYDRVVSGFMEVQRAFRYLPRFPFAVPWIRDLVIEQLSCEWSAMSRAGFDVNRWFQQLPEHAVLDSAARSTFMLLHPCVYWTHKGKAQGVDFIGRVERFEADFESLKSRYRIGPTNSRDANRSTVAEARPDANNYRYIDQLQPRTIDKINALFRQDFERLGYRQIVPQRPTGQTTASAVRPPAPATFKDEEPGAALPSLSSATGPRSAPRG